MSAGQIFSLFDQTLLSLQTTGFRILPWSDPHDPLKCLFGRKAARKEGADPVNNVLDRDESDEKAHYPGQDSHAEVTYEPVEVVGPVEAKVGGGEYRHGADYEHPELLRAGRSSGKNDACRDCSRSGQDRNGERGNGYVLLGLREPRFPAAYFGPRGPAIEEIQGDDEKENSSADLDRRGLNAEIGEYVMPPREEEDDYQAADGAPPTRQSTPFSLIFVRRDGEKDRDACDGIDDNKELDSKNSKKLK